MCDIIYKRSDRGKNEYKYLRNIVDGKLPLERIREVNLGCIITSFLLFKHSW